MQENAAAEGQTCPENIKPEQCPKKQTIYTPECKEDKDCFSGYRCCYDVCFDKKVCKLPKDSFTYTKKAEAPEENGPFCPKLEGKCKQIHSLSIAKKFICNKDDDCSEDEACCRDDCVKNFKICKKRQKRSVISEENPKCPKFNPEGCDTGNFRKLKICYEDNHCENQEVCCFHGCLKNVKVCKHVDGVKEIETVTGKYLSFNKILM